MNERIQELARQAGFNEYIIENLWLEEQPEFNKLIEKFAELIVRECYEECKEQLLSKDVAEKEGLTYNDGVMDCAIGLLQHFGVES